LVSIFLTFPTSDHQEVLNPDQQVAADKLEPVVAAVSCQAVQQMDCDPNQTPEKGDGGAVCTHTPERCREHEIMSGILRIVPSHSNVRNPNKSHQISSAVSIGMMLTVLPFAG
jgi:transcription factor E2F3